ncbi:MAG TPA: hypothetical protein VEQ63_08625 [Bryobacteraceae bacterium]|nr:hypothetical protein [Bryobacteraceae bacterium]
MPETIKTSTIFVTVGRHTHIYRSPKDMPPEIREKVKRTTSGTNTYTILIADRKGREKLMRKRAEKRQPPPARGNALKVRRHWLELALVIILVSLLWAVATWK